MKTLAHHDNRTHLRQELLNISHDYFPTTEAAVDSPLRMAILLGSGYAYNLAAAIEWVARNISPDHADAFANWLSDALVNGDMHGLNDDLTLSTSRPDSLGDPS
ncbi:hypothetical protein ACWGUL_01420 [Streptomyces albidoflavus]